MRLFKANKDAFLIVNLFIYLYLLDLIRHTTISNYFDTGIVLKRPCHSIMDGIPYKAGKTLAKPLVINTSHHFFHIRFSVLHSCF